jgi:hypothetical protein
VSLTILSVVFSVLNNSGSLFVEEGGVRVERFVEFVKEGFVTRFVKFVGRFSYTF